MKQRRVRPRRPPLSRLFRVWMVQHIQAFLFSLGETVRNPLGSLLTAAVIGISLALPAAFYITLANVRQVAGGWDATTRISLFLKMDVDADAARALAQKLWARPDVSAVKFISRKQALAEYKRMSGFASALDALDTNPLPALLLVEPRLDGVSAGTAGENLLNDLRKLPQVDTAQFDRQWVQRLFAILEIIQRAVFILAGLLAAAVLLVVGNTIRLAIFHRRTEIEVNKLFGATNAFIQRPFLYNGLIQGVAGALLAWVLVDGAVFLLSGPVARLAHLYLSSFALSGLGLRDGLILVAAGGFLGLAGSWLAVQRHLREIEPR